MVNKIHESKVTASHLPFFDDLFLNSPLCQICAHGSPLGEVCFLLLNHRTPLDLVIKGSQVISCSAHLNWLDNIVQEINRLGETLE